jgi:hypothetical protein
VTNLTALHSITPANDDKWFPHQQAVTSFDRNELNALLGLYGRHVANGEWRDYAIDFLKERAVFSVYRRTGETPLYRIEKNPTFARRQGAYSIITAAGFILKRGHELKRLLAVLDPKPQHVEF